MRLLVGRLASICLCNNLQQQPVLGLLVTAASLRICSPCSKTTTTTTPTTRLMATRDDQPPTAATTTNEEDLREAAKLQARLQNKRHGRRSSSGKSNKAIQKAPSVEIAEGVHKYVLIRASMDGEEQYVVTSRRGASYHRNAAEPMIAKLEAAGYYDIDVTGGGRIDCNETAKTIHIYGFSYGFGRANHAVAQQTVQSDPRYADYDVTISNDGY